MANEPTTVLIASPASPWTRVYLKAGICLVLGLTAGYLLRGLRSPASPTPVAAAAALTSTRAGAIDRSNVPSTGDPHIPDRPTATMGGHMPSLEQMKQMADKQAAPLLEKLKGDKNNSALLVQIGAIYHTSHQFKEAAAYYGKAAQIDPKNVGTRTKLASSLYRGGDVDGAIAQLNQALSYDPKDANALFDLGMIKLQGNNDGKGALAAWQKLLKTNPELSADRKATVQKLMVSVLTMLSDQNGIKGGQSNDGHKSNLN